MRNALGNVLVGEEEFLLDYMPQCELEHIREEKTRTVLEFK